MLPLYVVNNYGQFNHLILRTLRDMEIEATMISNETPPAEVARGGCRGVILGGGPTLARAGVASAYIDLGLPVLGICLGLHIMATARGGARSAGGVRAAGSVPSRSRSSNRVPFSRATPPTGYGYGHRTRTRSRLCRKGLSGLQDRPSATWKRSHLPVNTSTGSSGTRRSAIPSTEGFSLRILTGYARSR